MKLRFFSRAVSKLILLLLIFTVEHSFAQISDNTSEAAASSGEEISPLQQVKYNQNLHLQPVFASNKKKNNSGGHSPKQTGKIEKIKLSKLETSGKKDNKLGGKSKHLKKLNIQQKTKLLDLNWILVGIVIVAPALLIAGLYVLLGAKLLSFLEMFLLSLGFGMAVFSLIFLFTENPPDVALYEYFIRYGIATWPGWMMILAGLIGVFGGSVSFWLFLLIGLCLGLLSFLLSLFLKKSLFHLK